MMEGILFSDIVPTGVDIPSASCPGSGFSSFLDVLDGKSRIVHSFGSGENVKSLIMLRLSSWHRCCVLYIASGAQRRTTEHPDPDGKSRGTLEAAAGWYDRERGTPGDPRHDRHGVRTHPTHNNDTDSNYTHYRGYDDA